MGNAFRTRMKSSGKKGDRLLANRSIAAAGRLNTDTETRSSSAGNRTPWAMFPCLGQVGHGDACFAYFNKIWGIPGRQPCPAYYPSAKVTSQSIPCSIR